MIEAKYNGKGDNIVFNNDREPVTVCINGEIVKNISAEKSSVTNPLQFKSEYNNGFYSLDIKGNTEQNGDPSPESPSEIVNTGDNGTIITKRGKNLLPDYAWEINTTPNSSASAMNWNNYKDKVVYLNQGVYTINCRYTSPYARTRFVAFNDDKVRSVPAGQEESTDDYSISNNAYISVNGIAQHKANTPSKGNIPIVITVKKPIYIHFFFAPYSGSSGTTTSSDYTVYDCILNEGTKAEEYEPYIGPQSITFSSSYRLAKIGDYADEIKISKDGVRYIQRIGKFDSLTGWEMENDINSLFTGIFEFYTTIEDKLPGNDFLCTHYEVSSSDEKEIRIEGDTISGKVSIYDYINQANALEAFNNFLKEQSDNGTPVTIYYVLKSPIEMDITEEIENFKEFIKTIYDFTYIYDISSKIPPSLTELKYLKWGGRKN